VSQQGYETEESSASESEEDIDEGLFWWPEEPSTSNRSTSDSSSPRTEQDAEDTPREISGESSSIVPESVTGASESKPEGPMVDLPDELQLHCLSFLKLKHLLPLYGVSKQYVHSQLFSKSPDHTLTRHFLLSFRGLLAAEYVLDP
jgi:hypothetical protein